MSIPKQGFPMYASINRLCIYPVKSLKGIEVQQAKCLPTGLEFDREWVVVDHKNRFMTQRQLPKMATIETHISNDSLVLSHSEHGAIHVPLNTPPWQDPKADTREIIVWKDKCQAFDEGKAVSDWLTDVLEFAAKGTLHLMRFPQQEKRVVQPKFTQRDDGVLKFADACPYLVVNTESLDALNTELEQQQLSAIDMNRFRGNIEISGIPAWQEYQSSKMTIGDVILKAEGPCHRCPMPGIDQLTGITKEPGQPFKTLMELDVPEGKSGAYFGMHATFLSGEGNTIAVGDQIELI
ncbi:MOSC N-terminal beta barrel domain-containing protein [Paraneptunicella aestuarii]|uniref:MOSC domain-containing protein n=1 Tax=Paraneptunicella aestuarii TaxID=2831148 RepID=UPI001E48E42C|nr:MOSC N-terminal beta barrel domain-containing protein [Paraneptunicella aestuarii]UAA37948.1 MOSC N-terminal beta barrel domain-containing protein [Paraneptunicella aestuarii]